MKKIHILPFGVIEQHVLGSISEKLTEVFGFSCQVLNAEAPPEFAYDPERRQYVSTKILNRMGDISSGDALKVLGITDVDLCTPILTFVFGEAQLDAKCALISLSRLRTEFHATSEGLTIFRSRFEKEAIHEVAHTFGLRHCWDVNCVMHTSHSLYDTDVKPDTFCPSCRWRLDLKIAETLKRDP